VSGPGQTYDQYRETIGYSDWQKGRLDLTATDGSPQVHTVNR
jgi:hypothetical protein